MASICIVEDERDILNDLTFFLRSQDHEVYPCQSYKDYKKENISDFEGLFIIDWDLGSEKTGLDIVNEIRETNSKSLIYMLTGNTESQAAVTALKSGVDDFIKKPFSFEELVLKIRNALSRYGNHSADGIVLIPEAYAFQVEGKTLSLTAREFIIFEKLFTNKGQTVPRAELINAFNACDNITERNIDVHIFSLRKKIKETPITIKSIRSVGYILDT
jgi:DNA-binding response OmpR family regulator